MPDKSTWMSREQWAAADFAREMSQLRPHLAVQVGAQNAFDAMMEAILRFGGCELRRRRADRLRQLGLGETEAMTLTASAISYNEKGLAALSAVRPFSEMLAAQASDEQSLSRWRDSSLAIRAEWRDHVSQLDVAKGDAQHLARIMDECCKAMDERGLGGLGHYLSCRVNELDKVRRSDDRGRRATSSTYGEKSADYGEESAVELQDVEGLPVEGLGWKLASIAVIVGLALFAVWVLIQSGAPWWDFFLVALLACVMALLVALGC